MRSKKEKDELIQQNLKLIYAVLKTWDIKPYDYDDYISMGKIGLINAANTFDETTEIKFSTYAFRCIKNEVIRLYNNKKEIMQNEVSLNTPIKITMDGLDVILEEIISDPNSNFEKNIEILDCLAECLDIILNYLNFAEKEIVLYKLAGYTEKQIASILGYSRSNIANKNVSAKKKLKNNALKQKGNSKKYKTYSVVSVGSHFIIKCTSKNVEFTEELLKELKSLEKTKNSKIVCNSTNVINIKISTNTENFVFLAESIRKIDSFLKNKE